MRANLVTVVRRGRERLHYLNPTPIHEIEERWISAFDKPRLHAISAIKNQAEEHAMTSTTHDPDATSTSPTSAPARSRCGGADRRRPDRGVLGPRQRVRLAAGLDLGAPPHRRSGVVDVVGRVLETDPPPRLVITFEDRGRRSRPERTVAR